WLPHAGDPRLPRACGATIGPERSPARSCFAPLTQGFAVILARIRAGAPVVRLRDVMLSHERLDDLAHRIRHRYDVDDIATGLRERLPFGGVDRHREQRIGR